MADSDWKSRFAMKALLTVAIIALAGSAAGVKAADMARPYTKAPAPVAAVYNWTGVYVGVNAGGAWTRDDVTWTANPLLFGAAFTPVLNAAGTGAINASGVTAGGQVGYNYQASPIWLIGVEADINYTDLSRRRTTAVPPPGVPGTFVTSTFESKWLATVRGRAGILATPGLLLYGTGGAAFAEAKTTDFAFFAFDGSTNNAASNTTRTGWTAGAGAEWSFGTNWSAKLEYLYVDLGSLNYVSQNTLTTGATINHDHRLIENIVRVGVNYRFGGPVVAKY
jgi:outer membrane immunogenic protein